ncbi:MAG: hypothetical protein JWP25_1595 [Bradyrhizobium sp.]|nr:hypothetical protein [Bradyrhizobium sp.]
MNPVMPRHDSNLGCSDMRRPKDVSASRGDDVWQTLSSLDSCTRKSKNGHTNHAYPYARMLLQDNLAQNHIMCIILDALDSEQAARKRCNYGPGKRCAGQETFPVKFRGDGRRPCSLRRCRDLRGTNRVSAAPVDPKS